MFSKSSVWSSVAFAMVIAASSVAVGCGADVGDAASDVSTTSQGATSTYVEGSIKLDALGRSAVVWESEQIGYTYRNVRPKLDLALEFDDSKVRAAFGSFNGYERPFALVPRSENSGTVTWEAIPLKYVGASSRGYIALTQVDLYKLPDLLPVDAELVNKYGVALGAWTNVGTIWAQKVGDNFLKGATN